MLENNQNNELDTSPSVIKVAQLIQTLSGTLRLMPVSYTHLDVYKRQRHICPK